MTIRILQTLDSLNRGGAETLALDVCRNSSAAGFDLTFVATGGGDLESEFEASGVDYVRLHRRLPVDPFLIGQLRRIIRERKIQVVHAQQAVEAVHLWLATRGTGVKCIMSLHSYLFNAKNRIATKFVAPRMDVVCPVSTYLKDWYLTGEGFADNGRFRVLPNGVDVIRLAPVGKPGSPSLRKEFGIPTHAPLLGMVGNFYADERKDQLTACRAFPAILARLPDAHVVFVGSVADGAEGYFGRCRNLCREQGTERRMHFTGKRGDVADILGELDLFVFSSVQEGQPIAAIEALLLGVPMIVSDIPPLLEVGGKGTTEGLCVEVFRTGDADDLAQKVISLLIDKDWLNMLGEKARVQTSKYYSIETHLAAARKIYEELVSSRD